ncbi:multi-pass transmembrane [Cryptosporidium sp. chipmunk genotype I]|uniref:multi-pass transmembrane n=1 Tax=Cryptosporidium sp. chipmunk genotype I TaxID=1280935 RepID=UPI00351A37C4|nr:multi-pass transmembrane [Cryptosporidium sp. chipmunk genotype I]
MAGQSAKRIAKEAAKYTSIYLYIMISCISIHFIFKRLYNPSNILGKAGFGFAIIFSIYLFTYSSIKSRLEVGVGYSMYQDVYILNSLVAILSIISNYFWCIFCLIPIYIIYKIGRLIINWVFTPEPVSLQTD